MPNKDDKRYSGTWLVECANRPAYEATIQYGQMKHTLMDRIVSVLLIATRHIHQIYIRQLPCDPEWPEPSTYRDEHGKRSGGDRRGGGRGRRDRSRDRADHGGAAAAKRRRY